ncbi:uncharacterized protein K489DRAFT_381133, partial [Dissoconium aciculare CBS 342.82]|uniref:Uncharacterized protein n=1 Tax=Dissoconium aciculare CBS 342.82 TaxID=1314786 RepID=A0A6J3M3B0_9PEZI
MCVVFHDDQLVSARGEEQQQRQPQQQRAFTRQRERWGENSTEVLSPVSACTDDYYYTV